MIKKQLLIFLVLVLTSPWFLIYLFNFREIASIRNKIFRPDNEILLSEINTLQGEAVKIGLGPAGRLTVNKITWPLREILGRYLESFDTHFLFIEGDLDARRSTRTSGPILLTLLPFIAAGFFLYFRQGKNLIPLLVILLPMAGVLADQHYETTLRLPFILGLTWIAAYSLAAFSKMKNKRFLKTFLVLFYLFEYLRFIHYFFLHYPYAGRN